VSDWLRDWYDRAFLLIWRQSRHLNQSIAALHLNLVVYWSSAYHHWYSVDFDIHYSAAVGVDSGYCSILEEDCLISAGEKFSFVEEAEKIEVPHDAVAAMVVWAERHLPPTNNEGCMLLVSCPLVQGSPAP
jgi:hypothetical protein